MSKHTPLKVAFSRPWPSTRRGLCLWLFALTFVSIGMMNYVLAPELPYAQVKSLSFAVDIMPLHYWGYGMVASGLIAALSSYCHFGRDRYGFVILATYAAGWALVYISGFLFYDAGVRALVSSNVWFLFSGVLMAVSGFPNVNLRTPPLIRGEDE